MPLVDFYAKIVSTYLYTKTLPDGAGEVEMKRLIVRPLDSEHSWKLLAMRREEVAHLGRGDVLRVTVEQVSAEELEMLNG